jgi:hypothetical protein
MVAAASQKAHDAAEAAARRRYDERQRTSPPPAPQPNATPTAQAAAPGMTAQDILRISAFTAAAAEHGIPARGVEMLLERVMLEKPADVRGWTGTEAASYGWSKVASTPPAGSPAAPATAAAQPLVPPTPTPSGSPPAPSAGGSYDLKPTQMKPADVTAYIAKNGYKAFAALVRAELSGTRVTAPPRR